MNRQEQQVSKTTLKIINLATLSTSVTYFILIYLLRFIIRKMLHIRLIFDNKFYVIAVIISLVLIALINPIKEKIWKIKKKDISSSSGFYSSLILMSIVVLGMTSLIDICALLLFFFTGNWIFSFLLLSVSFIGKIIYYPWRAEIDKRKTEFGFLIN